MKYTNENPPIKNLNWRYTGSTETSVLKTWAQYGFKPAKKYIFIVTKQEIK
jgi:hypothetical protein